MKPIFLFVICLFVYLDTYSQNWQLLPDFYITNGQVSKIEIDSTHQVAYLAGTFTNVGPPTFFGGVIDTNGQANINAADYNSTVDVAIAGPNNSWFVGGYFTKVGECERSYLAQIDSNGVATNMFKDHELDGYVHALELKDSILYVGGGFSSVGKTVQFNAFVDENSNTPDFFDSYANNTVNQIVDIPEGGWYVAGKFTEFGDSIRKGIVKLNPDKSIATWAPKIEGTIYSILIVGDTLFIGGDFNLVDGINRSNVAAFNRQTGVLLNWAPETDGWVLDMDVFADQVIISGYFDQINGLLRNSLGSINKNTGVLSGFNPNPNLSVRSIDVSDGDLFVAGDFTSISGQARGRVAKINMTSYTLQNWAPSINDLVNVIEADNDYIFIGGSFTTVNGISRKKFAAFNSNTGILSNNVTCDFDGSVLAIKRINNKLVLGGSFGQANNITRSRIAELDILNNSLTNFSINVSSRPTIGGDCSILAFSKFNGEFFIGGNADFIGGVGRYSLAAFNINNGTLTNLEIPVSGVLESVAVKDSLILLGGNFSQILNQPRNHFGIVNLNSTTLLPAIIQPNSFILEIHIIEDTVYLGGSFTNINGQTRNKIAALRLPDQQLFSWNPNFDNSVLAMEKLNNSLIVGGNFTTVNGISTGHAVCISRNNNSIQNIGLQNINGPVNDFCQINNKLHIVGSFSSFGSIPRDNYAILNLTSSTLDSVQPNPTLHVSCVAPNNYSIFAGGSFTSIGTSKRKKIAAIDLISGQVTDWAPIFTPSNFYIFDIEIVDDEVFLGGYFLSVNTLTRHSLASLSRFDATVSPVNANINYNGSIRKMTFKDSLIYFTGWYDTVSGVPKNNVAAFNFVTNSLSSWNPPISDQFTPSEIELINDEIFIGNVSFTGNETVQLIAEVDPIIGNPINSHEIGTSLIKSIDNYGDTIVISGDMNTFEGQPASNILLFDNTLQQIIPFDPLLPINSEPFINVYENNLYVYSSYFGEYYGSYRTGIAEQNINDFSLTSFHQNHTNIGSMARSDDMLIIGWTKIDEFDYGGDDRLGVFQRCSLPTMGNIQSVTDFCLGEQITLNLQTSSLNDATNWVWYVDDVGCEPIGFGPSITITPQETTKIIVRGEGGCVQRQKGINTLLKLDDNGPVITNCPSDQTIPFDSPGCTAVSNWSEPAVTDDCPGSILSTLSHTAGSLFQHGTTPVTYTFIDTAGNSSYCVFNINVTSNLSFSGVSQDVDCYNSSTGTIDITPVGGTIPYNFDWNNGQFTTEDLSNLNAGIYNFSLTDANGCDLDSSFTIAEPSILDTSVVVSGTTIVSTNTSAGVTYTWLDCQDSFSPVPGQNGQGFNVTANGIYAVQITQNGCSNVGSCYNFLDLSVFDISNNQAVVIPNPTLDFFSISSNMLFDEVNIIEMTGKVLKTFSFDKAVKYDISDLPDGLFIVELKSNTNFLYLRIVKK